MFPSREKAQQLLEQVDALINGAVIKFTCLTLPMVLRIEAHIMEQGTVLCTVAFNARRVNKDVLWTFFGDMVVEGIRFTRDDTTTSLGARLRVVPQTHAARGYSLCEGPLIDYLICIRRSKMVGTRHRVEERDGFYVHYPLAPESVVFRDERAASAVKMIGLWRVLACATSVTKNESV